MLKSISLFFLTFLSFVPTYAADANLQNNLTGAVSELVPEVRTVKRTMSYADIAKEIQRWIFLFIGIIAVGYIIYIGAQLLWAPGNMEEMKSAMKSLMYVIVGLALIPFAYFLVNFIINIRL